MPSYDELHRLYAAVVAWLEAGDAYAEAFADGKAYKSQRKAQQEREVELLAVARDVHESRGDGDGG